jgi:hypothetical protein
MIIDEAMLRKKSEAGRAVNNARRTIALAKIRCLPFDTLIADKASEHFQRRPSGELGRVAVLR